MDRGCRCFESEDTTENSDSQGQDAELYKGGNNSPYGPHFESM